MNLISANYRLVTLLLVGTPVVVLAACIVRLIVIAIFHSVVIDVVHSVTGS